MRREASRAARALGFVARYGGRLPFRVTCVPSARANDPGLEPPGRCVRARGARGARPVRDRPVV